MSASKIRPIDLKISAIIPNPLFVIIKTTQHLHL